ncbi:hypothetical protein [Sphingopyxis sp.]|uniref:hypothetical protein n=1 Tax=Sphingopyxis sp. TaxID=1908224 RepID=UPI002D789696|nr:hypothetical protein [Sphingopyxis sp.]HET6526058.1 hypothetical protein [Sphingopyxis sp.]
MEDEYCNRAEVAQIRDRLLAELDFLDGLGERLAAVELNSTIEILTGRLGEKTSPLAIETLRAKLFSE